MAGNIVKWWRQLKQYKQFSVLQECSTDSEELLYKTQSSASSSKSHTDSLLHKNIQQQSNTRSHANHNITLNRRESPDIIRRNNKSEITQVSSSVADQKERINKRHSIATTRHLNRNSIKFEELPTETIPSKNEPLQFSFTLYDLDGHGKITKDDIAGIVSTIYESIGNSVAVPHCGKKTINVKLTVSPENCTPSHISNRKIKINALLNECDKNSESDNNENNIYCTPKLKSVNEDSPNANKEDKNEINLNFTKTNTKRANEEFPRRKNTVKKDKRKIRNSSLRTRSYSVGNGNEYSWKRNKEAESEKPANNEDLRRHELIQIIRETMEKNRLCFQNKTPVVLNHSRPRANTTTCTKTSSKSKEKFNEKDQNRCAFDAVLHSTICSNLKASKNENTRRRSTKIHANNTTPVLKLKTSVLNQFNPNLTPEEKFNRKFNDIEKWLFDREVFEIDTINENKVVMNKNTPLSPVHKKSLKNHIASATKIPPPDQLKNHKEKFNISKMREGFEHLEIPVSGNASEFESLIDLSENDDVNSLESASKSSSVKFVHIHHHFYHFNNEKYE